MKQLLAVLLLMLAGCSGAAPELLPPGSGLDIPEDVVQSIRARVDNGYNTGIVIGTVDAGGTSFFGYGLLSAESSTTPDENTIFEIGSISKVFTALLLADMVQRGEVRLEDPIEKYLPSSVTAPMRGGRSITLADLATQTSGLPRLPGNMSPANPANPYADYSVEQLYSFLSGYELQRDIGAEYEYSNLGFGLLGHILELRSGLSYEQLVEERVGEPLGLEGTRVTLSGGMRDRLARGHSDGATVENWDLPVLAGAGALRSDAGDMLRFVAANLSLANTPLLPAMRMTHEPRASAAGPNLRIGLGWHILDSGGKQTTWHNGGTGGYRSFAGFVAGEGRGTVVLTNSNTSVDDIGFHLLNPAAPLQPVRTRVQVDAAILDEYAGEYQLAPGVVIDVTRQGDGLGVQLTGQPRFRPLAESETKFFLTVVDAQFTFVRDVDGTVSSLILHQGGRDQPAPRR